MFMKGNSRTIGVGKEIRGIGIAAPAKRTFGKRMLEGPLSLAWKLPAVALGAYLLAASPAVRNSAERFFGSRPAAAAESDFYGFDLSETPDLGMAYAEVGNKEKAKKIANKLLKKAKGDDFIDGAAGIFMKLGDRQGIKTCISLLEKETSCSEVDEQYMLAKLYNALYGLSSGDEREKCREKALEALGGAPQGPESALLYLELGERERARAAMDAAEPQIIKQFDLKGKHIMPGEQAFFENALRAYLGLGDSGKANMLVKYAKERYNPGDSLGIFTSVGLYDDALGIVENAEKNGESLGVMGEERKAVLYARKAASMGCYVIWGEGGSAKVFVPEELAGNEELMQIRKLDPIERSKAISEWLEKRGSPGTAESKDAGEASHYIEKAMEIARKMDWKYPSALVYYELGMENSMGEALASLEIGGEFNEAADIALLLGDKDRASKNLDKAVWYESLPDWSPYIAMGMGTDFARRAEYAEAFAKTGKKGGKWARQISEGLLWDDEPETSAQALLAARDQKGMESILEWNKAVDALDSATAAELECSLWELSGNGALRNDAMHSAEWQAEESSLYVNALFIDISDGKKPSGERIQEIFVQEYSKAVRAVNVLIKLGETEKARKAYESTFWWSEGFKEIEDVHVEVPAELAYELTKVEHLLGGGFEEGPLYDFLVAGDHHLQFKGWAFQGEYGIAEQYSQYLSTKDPKAMFSLANFYIQRPGEGEAEKAADLGKAYQVAKGIEDYDDMLAGIAYALLGKTGDATRCINSMKEDGGAYDFAYEIAQVYLALGMKGKARESLVRGWRYENGYYGKNDAEDSCWETKGWAGPVTECPGGMSGHVD